MTPYFVCPNGNPPADCLHFPNLPVRAQMLFSRLFKTPVAPAKVQEVEQSQDQAQAVEQAVHVVSQRAEPPRPTSVSRPAHEAAKSAPQRQRARSR